MFFRFKRFWGTLVLGCFLFQTLWPSVVFANLDVPLGSLWQDNPCGLTFKVTPYQDTVSQHALVRIQAFANPQEEWGEGSSSSASSIASPSAKGTIKKLLDRVVNVKTYKPIDSESAQALYQDLVVKSTGISWGFLGLSFALDWKGNVVTTGTSLQDMAVKICTPGDIGLDNVAAKHILAKGKTVSVRGDGRLQRLDVWATGDSQTKGIFKITQGSHQDITRLYVHQGQGENYGQLSVQESLHHTTTFDNHHTLQLGLGATVKGGTRFTNTATVDGEAYTVQSEVVRNQGSQQAVMRATQRLTLEAKKLEQKGSLKAPLLDLTHVSDIDDDLLATLTSTQLTTALTKSWTLKGRVEADDWHDTSSNEVFL